MMMAELSPRAELIRRLAEPLGFTLLGIAEASPSDGSDYFRHWLAAGRHGEMDYLARQVDLRLNVAEYLPGAKSVICVAYACGSVPAEAMTAGAADASAGPGGDGPPSAEPRGRIARYAWRRDYHHVIKKRLQRLADELRVRHPQHTFRASVDTAPVMEREHAARAGLGWIGKHTLLIHPRKGSFFLLGEIVTTLRLQSSVDAGQPPIHNACGTCTRCIDACPTQCIDPAGYRLDASRCISYLTLEHRETIDPQWHEAMGTWIAGCDVCQEVCPFNQAAGEDDRASCEPGEPPMRNPTHGASLPLRAILDWDEAARRKAFERSALKRIRLGMAKRNALIAAGNYLSGREAPALRQRIEELANDPSEPPMVRVTARQVLDRLERNDSGRDE